MQQADEIEEHKRRIALETRQQQRELEAQKQAISEGKRPKQTRNEKHALKTPPKSSILKPQAITNGQEQPHKRKTPHLIPTSASKKAKMPFQSLHLPLEGLMYTFTALFLRLSPQISPECENMPTKDQLEAHLEMQAESLQGHQDQIESLMIDLRYPGDKGDIKDFKRHVKKFVALCESKAKADGSRLQKQLDGLAPRGHVTKTPRRQPTQRHSKN